MSYILDALRRSQSERERGQVPGLDAQPAAVATAPSGAPRTVPVAWWVGGAVAALIVAGIAAWFRPAAPPPRGADAPSPAPQPLPAAPAPQQPTPAPRVAQAPPPRPAAVATSPPAPTAPSPLPIVVSAPPPPPAVAAEPSARAAAPSGMATPPAAPLSPPRATSARIPPLAELSAEQRRDLPALAVGGSVWSDSPASRFVIINGQVVREGEAAAPGVVVERIGPKAAVLRWRELRFELAY